MKRQLLVEIDCGKVVCGDCDWFHDGACDMFQMSLVDDAVRDPLCLQAEAKADELMLKMSMAKAATTQGEGA